MYKGWLSVCACTCGSNTPLKFQITILKIERGIAEMPFFSVFCRKHSTYGIEFWQYLLMGGGLGNETYTSTFF